jgi:mRNA interferase MazF
MECKPGALVFVPFPYSDLKTSKKRPVLMLTVPDKHGDFIGLAVTSVQTDVHAIRIENPDLLQGSLPKASWIRVDKIFTLSQNGIVKVFGFLTPVAIERVLDGLCRRLGCTDAKG